MVVCLRQLDLILFGWFSNRDTIIYPTYYILPLFSRPQDGIIVWLKICRSPLAGTGYGKWAETGQCGASPHLAEALHYTHYLALPWHSHCDAEARHRGAVPDTAATTQNCTLPPPYRPNGTRPPRYMTHHTAPCLCHTLPNCT